MRSLSTDLCLCPLPHCHPSETCQALHLRVPATCLVCPHRSMTSSAGLQRGGPATWEAAQQAPDTEHGVAVWLAAPPEGGPGGHTCLWECAHRRPWQPGPHPHTGWHGQRPRLWSRLASVVQPPRRSLAMEESEEQTPALTDNPEDRAVTAARHRQMQGTGLHGGGLGWLLPSASLADKACGVGCGRSV